MMPIFLKHIICLVLCFNMMFQLNGQNKEIQDSTINKNILKSDSTIVSDTSQGKKVNIQLSRQDIQKIVSVVKQSYQLRQIIKKDYKPLFVLKGIHPMIGYAYQGFSSLNIGLGYGKRHLFKPLTYQNIHSNLLIYSNSNNETKFGLNLGFTKSKTFGFWGIELLTIKKNTNEYYWAIRPEIGVSVLGTFHIGYGYNITRNNQPQLFETHSFVVRYTHHFFKQSIKNKIKQFNMVFNRDYYKLKSIGLDIKNNKK